MTIEANKRVMKQFLVFINTASEALATELQGPSGYLALIGMMRGGFPDIQWTLEETIAEGDKIAARFTMRGTHQGTFLGVPPTGRKIEVKAMNFYRLSGGQFVEEHGQPDLLGVLQQIGAMPN